MSPLGLQNSLMGQNQWSVLPSAINTETLFWGFGADEIAGSSSVTIITPLAKGTVVDTHSTWDLTTQNYMPELASSHSNEGKWEVGTSSSTSIIFPIEV